MTHLGIEGHTTASGSGSLLTEASSILWRGSISLLQELEEHDRYATQLHHATRE